MKEARRIDAPIPITLLTGFLGSGKTTLLNDLVQQPEMARTMVIINEFGDVGLDHLLVSHCSDDTVVQMSSGCVCCTIRGDLIKALRDITWRFSRGGQRRFDRVIIETTGLADPAPILHTLLTNEFISTRYRLDGVVATIDLTAGNCTLNSHPEAAKQAAVADLLVLTKGDITPAAVISSLKVRLQAINPGARQIMATNGHVSASALLHLGLFDATGKIPDVQRWLNAEAYEQRSTEHRNHQHPTLTTTEPDVSNNGLHDNHDHDPNRHDDQIHAFCFQFEQPFDPGALANWTALILPLMGQNMLRIKGIINVCDNPRPMVIHGVQHIFQPPVQLERWPDEDRRSKLVFITRNIDRSVIEGTLRFFLPRVSDRHG